MRAGSPGMTDLHPRLNVLIAHAGECPWARGLARSLAPLPVGLHWSHTDDEAVGMAAGRGMHVAVVDDGLPPRGGLDTLRRMRRMGLVLPCLLVCDDPGPRLLRDAIELDVFSVVYAEAESELLTPMVLRIVRRVYDVEWPMPGGFN